MADIRWMNGTPADVALGDRLLTNFGPMTGGIVAALEPGRLPEGATYVDATMDTGEVKRMWFGFEYRIGKWGKDGAK